MTDLLARRKLKTRFGTFEEQMFANGAIALVAGSVGGFDDVLCRIHSSCLSGHAFNSVECKCREEMEISQRIIQKEGRGVIIWLEQEGRGNGHLAVMKSTGLKKKGISQSHAYELLGYSADARSFRPAADVLQNLEVKSVRLLTGSPKKADQIRGFGIAVTGVVPVEA